MRKKCFVVMDFDSKYNNIYYQAIKPAVEKNGIECIRADELSGVTQDVIGRFLSEIQSSSLVIADLTGNNVNVAYEIGYAQKSGIKTVLISQTLDNIPFDFRNQIILEYRQNNAGLLQLQTKLETIIQNEILSPGTLLREMILPESDALITNESTIAASPLSFEEKKRRKSNSSPQNIQSYAEYVGITRLIQAFGIIFQLEVIPNLISPRDFTDKPDDINTNLYLLGGPKCNKWTEIMLKQISQTWKPEFKFTANPESKDISDPWIDLRINEKLYEAESTKNRTRKNIDFGLVIRIPKNEKKDLLTMILAGRTGLGTAAACLAVTTTEHINSLIHDWDIKIADALTPFWAIVSMESKDSSLKFYDYSSLKIEDAHIFEAK